MKIIAGKFKGRALKAPKGMEIRPTPSRLRETLFNIIQFAVEDATLLDLFAGSGLIGFEALSRAAKEVIFIDQGKESIRCLKENSRLLEVKDKAIIIKSDVIESLQYYASAKRQFDLIYADPPYNTLSEEGELLSKQVLFLIDEQGLLKEGGRLFIEEGYDLKLEDQQFKTLEFKRTKKCGKATLHELTRSAT